MTSAFAHLGTIRTAEARPPAPREFSAIGRAGDWINSPPLTPERLAGKVVLVNFWTYTCINWLRTLPYVRAWAQKYQQQLVVVGVHTPEFAFERNIDNVRRAVRQMNIEYPVAIDNEYAIWRTFDNHYWPAVYLLDARGRVRGHRFGEGEYDKSEQLIQRLLAEVGAAGVGGQAFIERLAQRKEDLEPASGPDVARAQMASFREWEQFTGTRFADLKNIRQPALVVNGVHDEMIPVSNS